MTEEWRPVPGYDGWYDVSNHGRVRSWRVIGRTNAGTRADSPRLLMQMHKEEYKNPYWTVALSSGFGGSTRRKSVHVLVCEAFHGPRPDGLVVRHLNNIKTDNRAENLAWGTRSQNARDWIDAKTPLWYCCCGRECQPPTPPPT